MGKAAASAKEKGKSGDDNYMDKIYTAEDLAMFCVQYLALSRVSWC